MYPSPDFHLVPAGNRFAIKQKKKTCYYDSFCTTHLNKFCVQLFRGRSVESSFIPHFTPKLLYRNADQTKQTITKVPEHACQRENGALLFEYCNYSFQPYLLVESRIFGICVKVSSNVQHCIRRIAGLLVPG